MAIGIICNVKVDSRAPVCQQPGLPMWPFAFHTPRQKIVHGTQLSLALSHRHMKACNYFFYCCSSIAGIFNRPKYSFEVLLLKKQIEPFDNRMN